MKTLTDRMGDDMRLRGFAPKTQQAYHGAVIRLATLFRAMARHAGHAHRRRAACVLPRAGHDAQGLAQHADRVPQRHSLLVRRDVAPHVAGH